MAITKIGTLHPDGTVTQKAEVDFTAMQEQGISDDPIAYFFGIMDGQARVKLPPKRSEEYKELAPEYLRGYKECWDKVKTGPLYAKELK